MARGEDIDIIILVSTLRQRKKKVDCKNKLWGQTKMQKNDCNKRGLEK
jgi:hypothetical protein